MPRLTLRQLPLPAKLVVTVFLLTVGLGYTSAMVQLHMQHGERDGMHLPTVENVVSAFAGKKWQGPDDPVARVVRPLERIISGPPTGGLTGANMAPAFFALDGADYKKKVDADPAGKGKLDAEREGERKAMIAWINTAPEARQRAYEENRFVLPKDLHKQPLTIDFRDRTEPEVVKIGSLLTLRCVRCHKADGDKPDVPLRTYEQLAKYMPDSAPVPPGGGWVDSGRMMSLEKLTQSTHAHLLSFAVLFGLTGLVFAFSGFPGWVRGVVAPLALLAQAADVSCWWLARLEGVGPYFAMCIVGTGAVVGMSLGAHIVGGLWSMYGCKGKAVLTVLFLLAGGAGGLFYMKKVAPFLQAERERVEQAKQQAADEANRVNPPPLAPAPGVNPVAPPKSRLETLLTWPGGGPATALPWKKDAAGGMARGFFDKDEDGEWKKAMKDGTDAEKAKLQADRDGERLAVVAWIKAAPDARKAAYEADQFAPPGGGPSVKVKSILDARCARCHAKDGEKEDSPLDTYDAIAKYLGAAKADDGKRVADALPAVAPIPMANE